MSCPTSPIAIHIEWRWPDGDRAVAAKYDDMPGWHLDFFWKEGGVLSSVSILDAQHAEAEVAKCRKYSYGRSRGALYGMRR